MLRKSQLLPLGKTLGILFLGTAMVIYPQEVLDSAMQGLTAWVKYVLPSLLPFFILSELLMGTGLVHLLGVLLEPVMRPLFRLPGSSAFVVTMGFISGPPISAVLTTKLYRENLLNRTEAERLLTFTNNASPGFVLGAVAAGMLGNPALGVVLAFSNYLANLLIGFGLRFYGRANPGSPAATKDTAAWRQAFRAMLAAQRKDGRPLGQLIGDSVRNSINTILLVGGFILLFSVLLRILAVFGVISVMTKVVGVILTPVGLNPTLFPAVASGLFETTLGVKDAAMAAAPPVQQALLAAAIMAWSGISVFAQVASFTAGTGISLLPFVIGRAVHALLAAGIVALTLHFYAPVQVFKLLESSSSLWKMQTTALSLALFTALMLSLAAGLLAQIVRVCFKR